MKKISLIAGRDSIIVYTIKLFVLFSVIFLTVGCGTRKTIDTVTPMVKSLPLLTKDQPAPLWQSTIQAREVDIIQYLSNNRILVGTLGLENLLGIHHRNVRKEMILVNATNGTVIWKYPRSAVGGDSQAVLTVDPVVLLQGVYAKKSKYQAIDPVSGKLVWEREVQAPKGIAQVTSHGSIIFTSSVGSSLELVSVKLKDGSEAWKSKIEKYSLEENMQPDLMLSGQDLIITGPEVVKLSVTDGRIDWRKPFIGTFNSTAISIFQGKNLFCSDGTKLSMIDTESGIPVWSSSLSDGNIKLIGPAEDSVLLLIVMTSGDQPVRTIRSVYRKSGKLLWSVTLKEELRSPFLIDEQILRCSTKSQLMALKLKTGDLL